MRFKIRTFDLRFLVLALISIALVSCSQSQELPGNFATFGKFTSDKFTAPDTCMSCHSTMYNAWSGSMHNNAYNDPLYQKVLEVASKDTDSDRVIEAFCVACHSPIGFVSGEIPPVDGSKLSVIAKNGVQCDYCHTVKGENGIGNFSGIKAPGLTKRGPFMNSKSPFHETAYSQLHTKSEFCGSCHDVRHPMNELALETTFTEWRNSPYYKLGIQCQDCHMTPGPSVTKPNPGKASVIGPDRPHIWTHTFAGANSAVPSLLGAPDQAAAAIENLKAAADIAILQPIGLDAGGTAQIQVKVTNKGAGHYLPTGLTETRQMWLELEIKDSTGKTVISSGTVDGNGVVDEGAIMYHTVVADKEGKATDKVWRAEKILSDHRIPPKQSVTETYKVNVPASAKRPFNVTATLKYRSAPQEVANELFGEKAPELPITDMATASLTL